MKYSRDDTARPLYTIHPLNGRIEKKVCPPRCALPLSGPLQKRHKTLPVYVYPCPEQQESILVPKPYRIMQNIRTISSLVHRNAAIDNNKVYPLSRHNFQKLSVKSSFSLSINIYMIRFLSQ